MSYQYFLWHANHYAAVVTYTDQSTHVQVYQLTQKANPTITFKNRPLHPNNNNNNFNKPKCPGPSSGTVFAPKVISYFQIPSTSSRGSNSILFETWLICQPPLSTSPDTTAGLVMAIDVTSDHGHGGGDGKLIATIPWRARPRGQRPDHRFYVGRGRYYSPNYKIIQSKCRSEVRLIAHHPYVDCHHIYVLKFNQVPGDETKRTLEIVQRLRFPGGRKYNYLSTHFHKMVTNMQYIQSWLCKFPIYFWLLNNMHCFMLQNCGSPLQCTSPPGKFSQSKESITKLSKSFLSLSLSRGD